MTRTSPRKKVFRSFEEYKKAFYPSNVRDSSARGDDPYAFGLSLAERSLSKVCVTVGTA